MSEKLKPNFTPVPNVLLDEVMRTLAPGATKVLFAICRYTYGWGKQSDRISSNQLAEMTGMDRSNVRRSLKQLGELVIIRPGDPKRNQASEYQLNIDVSNTDLVSLRQQVLVSSRHQPGVRPGVKTPPIRRNPKKENPPDAFSPIVEKIVSRLNKLSGRAYQADTKAVCKYLRARLKAGATESDCMAVVEDRWHRWGDNEKMREHFNPVTLFREEHFDRYLAEAKASTNANGPTEEQRQRQRRETFVNG
jgi:phage replication O-like protein O